MHILLSKKKSIRLKAFWVQSLLTIAGLLGCSLSAVAGDRVAAEAYNSSGGPRNGQQSADNGWNFFGFDLGGLWRSRSPEPIQKGPQFPGYAPDKPAEFVPDGQPIDTRSKPEPDKKFDLPNQVITAKTEVGKLWIFNSQGQKVPGCYMNMTMTPIANTGGLPLYKGTDGKTYYKMSDGSGPEGGPDWRPYR